MEGQLEISIRLAAQRDRAKMAGVIADFSDEAFDMALVVGKIGSRVSCMGLEGFIYRADIGNLARQHGEVMPHEAVEVRAIGFLPKVNFHWSPKLLIQFRLQHWLQSHQYEIANEVGLAKFLARRVHALEDELWVVLVAGQRDVHHHQLRQPLAEHSEIHFLRLNPVLKEIEITLYAQRRLLRLLAAIHDGVEGGLIGLRKQQLEVPLSRFFWIH